MQFNGYINRLVLFGSFVFLVYVLSPIPDYVIEKRFRNYSLVPMISIPSPVRNPNKTGPKTIVWYDFVHNGHGLRNSVSNAKFDKCKGPGKNCEMRPHILGNNLEEIEIDADAVIFQSCHLKTLAVPKRKDFNQVFIVAERENMVNNYKQMLSNKNMLAAKGVFNWTMTYRHDSDIVMSYGEVKKSLKPVKNINFKNIYINKKYDAVWFVSDCKTHSKRETFVRELQNYITVHIYGKCGNFTCPKRLVDRDTKNDCIESSERDYKFVLSFENSYIPNYVTEKFFDWFPRNIVQVVRGGGGYYSKYGAPDGTTINADRFSSAEDLGLFLKAVGSSSSRYLRYLRKKQGYYTVSKETKQNQAYCRLCEMLQNVQEYRHYYTNIWAWLDSDLFSSTYHEARHQNTTYMYIYLVWVMFIVCIGLIFYFLRKALFMIWPTSREKGPWTFPKSHTCV